jgi:hypothetical protein
MLDKKYKVQCALNCPMLCVLFRRSHIWLIRFRPTFLSALPQQSLTQNTYLISKVCCLDNIAKKANLNNPSKQLDIHEELIAYQ